MLEREALAPRMNQIEAPTLFIVGRFDVMYPVETLKTIEGSLRNGRFEVLDTAHISVVDDPARVTSLIDDFLQLYLQYSTDKSNDYSNDNTI
jgi:pimeloyl-ACP methyl ester carboxylesterase